MSGALRRGQLKSTKNRDAFASCKIGSVDIIIGRPASASFHLAHIGFACATSTGGTHGFPPEAE
jgi:hypothetical protein